MIRRFLPQDTQATTLVWLRSGLAEYTYLPDFQKLDERAALEIFREVILARCEIWVDESAGVVRGFIAMKGSYVDRLYVDPSHQRCGIGAALLEHAKTISPDGLELHTHQQNHRARQFYEKYGFQPVKFGISPAPESVPDVEYRWRDPGGDW